MNIKPVLIALAGSMSLLAAEGSVGPIQEPAAGNVGEPVMEDTGETAKEPVAGSVEEAKPKTSSENTVTVQKEIQEDAAVKRPDGYEDPTFYDTVIFVGDSRTVGMRDCVGDTEEFTRIWSCKSAMGYDWMVNTGIPQIEEYVADNTAVVILMGVNDPGNIQSYVDYMNEKAKEWTDLGVDTYYAAVGPVNGGEYVSNEQIEAFNISLETSLAGITYIDLYDHLVTGGYSTVDGVHYTGEVYRDIYQYIVDNLECDNGGTPDSIWG